MLSLGKRKISHVTRLKTDHVNWISYNVNNLRSDRLVVGAVVLLNLGKLPIRRIAIMMIRTLHPVRQQHLQRQSQAHRLTQLRRQHQVTPTSVIRLQIRAAIALSSLNLIGKLTIRSYYVVFFISVQYFICRSKQTLAIRLVTLLFVVASGKRTQPQHQCAKTMFSIS